MSSQFGMEDMLSEMMDSVPYDKIEMSTENRNEGLGLAKSSFPCLPGSPGLL